MAVTDNGAAIWAVATRISQIDANGFLIPGVANVFVTDVLVKATYAPVVETGDDIAIKNAAGDLSAWGKHGDMVKYGTFTIEISKPDPQLEQVMAGGTVLSSSAAALGAPTGLTATAQATLGVLAAGLYSYNATQYNAFGETVASTAVTATTTGSTGLVVLGGLTLAAGAIGVKFYGRIPGSPQYLGKLQAIGSQATSAASGTGTVTSLTVTALTQPIPAGFTFTIAGDTNSPKIVFTTTAAAGIGTTTLLVSASQSVTTTIAAGAIQPVFVDTGAITPGTRPPQVDWSAGATAMGYQAPVLGPVANPNGFSIELWEKRMVSGQQATDYPYWHYVFPRIQNAHTMPYELTNANLQTILEAQAFANANWGTGPAGDWPFDSTKIAQRMYCGADIVPVPSITPTTAL